MRFAGCWPAFATSCLGCLPGIQCSRSSTGSAMELNPAEAHNPWLLGGQSSKGDNTTGTTLNIHQARTWRERVMTPKLRCLQYKGYYQPGLPQWKKRQVMWFLSPVLAAGVILGCILPFPCLFLPADSKVRPHRFTRSYTYMKS